MKNLKKYILYLLITLFLLFSNQSHASQVIDQSRTPGNLGARWEAVKGQNSNYWIAYSVDRLMDQYTYYVSTMRICGRIHSSKFFHLEGTTLSELIYGKKLTEIHSSKSSDPASRVMKEVVLLFQIQPGSRSIPVKIKYSNISMPFHSEGKTIYWLGKVKEEESFEFLSRKYPSLEGEDLKKMFISAIGFHTGVAQVIPFLEKIISGNDIESVRGKAAGELGDQQLEASINILLRTALDDHSLYVRRKAVSALEDVQLPGAISALARIAKEANNLYIRKRAVSALGDINDPRARNILIEIAGK